MYDTVGRHELALCTTDSGSRRQVPTPFVIPQSQFLHRRSGIGDALGSNSYPQWVLRMPMHGSSPQSVQPSQGPVRGVKGASPR